MGSGTGGPAGALDQPAEWTCALKPGEEAAGWVGKQISQQPGPGGKFREFPPGRCFLDEDGAEVIP